MRTARPTRAAFISPALSSFHNVVLESPESSSACLYVTHSRVTCTSISPPIISGCCCLRVLSPGCKLVATNKNRISVTRCYEFGRRLVRRSVSGKDFKMVNNWWRRPSQDPRPGGTVYPTNSCWVCENYDICQNRIVARFGSEDLDHWTIFDPLEEAPDLFLRFARLHREREFAQAALRFTYQYGLPCGTSRE